MAYLLEDTILKLKVISKITDYDSKCYRINVSTGKPIIQKIGFFSWVSRAITGESRVNTVDYIVKVFRQCSDLVHITITSTNMVLPPNEPITTYQRDKATNIVASLRALSIELENSIGGLGAVQEAYVEDSTVCAQVELLKAKAQRMIIRISRKVEDTDRQLGALNS